MTVTPVDASVGTRRSFQEVWVVSTGHALTHWYPATFYLLLPLAIVAVIALLLALRSWK